ncbi:MAG: hypothetical protein II117_00895 [Clostridia bacterium]|nr:hypothetical protein [Clostridia bacterium]
MLTRNLLKNPDRVEYCKEEDVVPALCKKPRIPDLSGIIRAFRGTRRNCLYKKSSSHGDDFFRVGFQRST